MRACQWIFTFFNFLTSFTRIDFSFCMETKPYTWASQRPIKPSVWSTHPIKTHLQSFSNRLLFVLLRLFPWANVCRIKLARSDFKATFDTSTFIKQIAQNCDKTVFTKPNSKVTCWASAAAHADSVASWALMSRQGWCRGQLICGGEGTE